MSKLKFRLVPDPTFKAKVDIPVPGAKPEAVEFTFKRRTRKEMLEFLESEDTGKLEDPDLILAIASGWELAEPFDRDNIAQLCENYMGAPLAIYNKYLAENGQQRLGNSAR